MHISFSQVAQHTGPLLPLKREAPAVETIAVTDEMKVPLCFCFCFCVICHLLACSRLRSPAIVSIIAVTGSDLQQAWLLSVLACCILVNTLLSDAALLVSQGERAYYRLRLERTNKKLLGRRTKRAAEAEAAEKDKAK